MMTDRALELVRTHRTRIDRHIDAALDLLRLPPEEARYPLALARWELVQLLREYHLFKREEIFQPAMRSGSAEQARRAKGMLQDCLNGWVGFTSYALDWSSRDIVAVWPDFREAMQDVAGRLHDHVAREEVLLRELLGTAKRTRALMPRTPPACDAA